MASAVASSNEIRTGDEHQRTPAVGSESHDSTGLPPNHSTTTTDPAKTQNSMKARKRTKTGCLTCRKRRIKCGEERPTCSNCIKSKRNCEGYTPRVIFKDPLNAFRPAIGTSQGAGAHFQHLVDQDAVAAHYAHLQAGSANQIPLLAIAPRPSPQDDIISSMAPGMAGHGDPYSAYGYAYDSQQHTLNDTLAPGRQISPQQSYWDGSADIQSTEQLARYYAASNAPKAFRGHSAGEGDSSVDIGYLARASDPSLNSDSDRRSSSSTLPTAAYANHVGYGTNLPAREDPGSTTAEKSPQSVYLKQEHTEYPNHLRESAQYGLESKRSLDFYAQPGPGQMPQEELSISPDDGIIQGVNGSIDRTPGQPLKPYPYPIPMYYFSTVDDREDDYWDVDSDEENLATNGPIAGATPSDLGMMLAVAANQNDRGIRSLHNFLNEPNVLSTYHPAYTASPLMDPQTARVFCHFVTATAPTLSLCERYPANPSVIFSGNPVPISQRSLWTYTLPMLALSHQGLLHAMLALASLHIAKLQQTSPTPSLKHYHYALRRVAKALGRPAKRQEVTTLAATLLLGFYEVTTAEHNKWNSHLLGAKQLVSDIDFVGMGTRIAAHKLHTKMNDQNRRYYEFNDSYEHPYKGREFANDLSERNDVEIDENLVSTIMGWKIKYDQYGQVLDGNDPMQSNHKPLTPKEMENYDTQCDLFWWYCKQDMYQCMVSRNRLLLPYDRWSHCPPRAPVGKLDAPFGTMDHLILLVARVADFAARDQRRKVRVGEMNQLRKKFSPGYSPASSDQVITASGMSPMPPIGGAFHGPSMTPQMQQPPMYGMMPPTAPPRLPSGFDQEPEDTNNRSPPDQELEALTLEAEAEWNSICHALGLFEESVGPDYQPLSPDHMQPLSTPFGPALYYRSYAIACIWTLFYTARIMAMRAHPSMPPASMVAAGVAAPRTAAWANTIGRICAGIQPVNNTSPINPTHGAALMDSCMGLFHAGVQYRDAAQRGWTITKLRDIARLTGWQTSALIASGCERSWMKAAEIGKGPPYQRTMNHAAKDDRVAGRSRDPTAKFQPPKDNNDRRFITVNPGTRVYWALGILSAEEDMGSLSLDG